MAFNRTREIFRSAAAVLAFPAAFQLVPDNDPVAVGTDVKAFPADEKNLFPQAAQADENLLEFRFDGWQQVIEFFGIDENIPFPVIAPDESSEGRSPLSLVIAAKADKQIAVPLFSQDGAGNVLHGFPPVY